MQIFTRRPPDGQLETQVVLDLLDKYPHASILYLEFLICDLRSEVRAALCLFNPLTPVIDLLSNDCCDL